MNITDEYFDVVKFCSDYPLNVERKKLLLSELEDITPTGGIDYSKTRVQCTPSADTVHNAVLRRMAKRDEIAEVDDYFRLFDRAFNRLTQEEKFIITVFFKEDLNQTQRVVKMAEAGFSHSLGYAIRLEALAKMKAIIVKYLEEKKR